MRMGIWESQGEFSSALRGLFSADAVIGNHPATFSQELFDLLLIAPSASGWAGIGQVDCRIALLPGPFLPLTRSLKAQSAISYGISPRNTITISSLENRQIGIAVQREITTLSGIVIEEQEFLLPLPPETDPTLFLGLTGARLLLIGKP